MTTIQPLENELDYKTWETAMSKVFDMSTWTQADKTELYFENMEQLILGEAYSHSSLCN